MGNIFKEIPTSLPEELVEMLIDSPTVRVERIVSRGHSSPPDFWYDQPEHEWVIVLQGEGTLRFQNQPETVTLRTGDYLNIPAHTKHRVESTSAETETIWLAVFYGD